VIRVRGKNILWLALIAMFFNAMLVTMAAGQYACTIYVNPPEIHNEDMLITTFTIDINVQNAEDLYSYAFTLEYAPYVTVLAVSIANEGDFLKEEGIDTDFVYKIDPFHGWVKIGNSRLGQVPGVSGNGTLATVTFTVLEAGDSPLNLADVEMYDSTVQLIACDVVSGYYYGAEIEFLDIGCDPGRAVNLKTYDSIDIKTTLINTGEVPLNVRVKYDIIGEGLWNTFYAGQSFVTTPREPEYLYINEYNAFYEWDWTNPGASVFGEPDGNYVESIIDAAMSSAYGFEDVTLGPGDLISRVVLEGYCQYPNGANEGVDIDTYSVQPRLFSWLGSLFGGPSWGWQSPRWIGADVSDVLPELLGGDPGPLNSLSVLLYNYEGNADNPMRVDALRVRVEFAQYNPILPGVYTLQPGETFEAEGTWALTSDDQGRYLCRATIEFTYNGYSWVQARKLKDFHLKIFDSTKIK